MIQKELDVSLSSPSGEEVQEHTMFAKTSRNVLMPLPIRDCNVTTFILQILETLQLLLKGRLQVPMRRIQ